MTPAYENALKASIEKWSRNYYFAMHDQPIKLGRAECPLCVTTAELTQKPSSCKGCPVHETTGRKYCIDTPYARVEHYADEFYDKPSLLLAIEDEITFLSSLRV